MKENPIEVYISAITKEHKSGQAVEHAYRPALKALFESVVPKLHAINDPKHSEHGAPDFALMRSKELRAGYAEAKDLKENLDDTEKGEQMERYLEYGSLILTNSLEFRFYRHGNKYGEPIVVAKLIDNEIVQNEKAYSELEDAIRTFLTQTEKISSSAKLAKIMGDKARRIRDKVGEYVTNEHERNEELRRMFESFKKILIHDLTEEQFADMYAQTLVYGLFAARFEDKTLENFTREEARDLIPKSNPFLRQFFNHIAGPDFDIRLKVIVNELCEVFLNADVHALMHEYATQKGLLGSDKSSADPVVHFYEDFLKEYDPEKRKKMGVFYTPLPVVQFIIRATDYLLEKEFGLNGGLSDTTKIEIKTTKQGKTAKESIHKVQILDPATGTGTFLNEAVKHIASRFKGQEGRWKSYVEDDLLPRLHGFELMMAPYTIAHLKIAMTLHDSGIADFHHRLGIYLTNSLEEGVKVEDSLFGLGFGQSITEESQAAAKIKNETPIMVVIGNPPYSVSSSNKGEWITNLIEVYKKGLNERNTQPLSDDYIKFIRFAEHFIEKTGSGIVAMITNNSYIDGITHRQMRKHLLETFDTIYILDLHGSTRKKEKDDENVFNIQQGVAISIFVRKEGKKKDLGTVHHAELYGKRENKFDALNISNLATMKWNELKYTEPYYFFAPKDFGASEEYNKGFKLDEFLVINTSGVKTHNDDVLVSFNEFMDNNYPYLYRPFDIRWIEYDLKKVVRHRFSVMKHMIKDNISLLTCRQQSSFDFQHIFVSKVLSDICSVSLQTKESTYVFPLYLYTDDGSKVPNLEKEILGQIEKIVGKVSPEDIFDYIYAVLHSPTYREKYKEFLKIDFPRVPYPKDAQSFKSLVALGKELRELHLLESPKLNKPITTFTESGSDIVGKRFPMFKETNPLTSGPPTKPGIYINEKQYFGVKDITLSELKTAWDFYIGGYQPAQKWLKDRKDRKLTNQDIEHYQKMIVALVETDKIMQEIKKIL
jgi:predicted helicase